MIHIGTYKLLRKRDGYTVDYCDTCGDYTQCDSFRYLLVLHVMFVPIFPLGFLRDWVCHVCKTPPRAINSTAEIAAGLLGIPLFGGVTLGALFFWLRSQVMERYSTEADWVFLVAAFLSGLITVYMIFRFVKAMRYRKRIRRVRKPAQIYKIETCLECGGFLESDPRLHCPRCGMKVF